MPRLSRRHVLAAAAALLGGAPSGLRAQQRAYPAAPIRIIVPYAPGGASDVLARLMAPGFQAALGQPVIVENRAGAAGQIGAEAVMRAPADGLTLLFADMPLTIVPALLVGAGRAAPYDPVADFAAVSLVGVAPMALFAHPSVAAADARDVVAAARARPDGFSIASGGIGSTSHLLAVLLQDRAGIRLLHVPYRGGGPAMQDLAAGQVHLGFTTLATAAPLVQDGTIRPLGVTSVARQDALPAVPTFREMGIALEVDQWFGVMAPAGTPRPVRDRLAEVTATVAGAPALSDRFRALGVLPQATGPDAMAERVRDDTARWSQIIQAAGIRAE